MARTPRRELGDIGENIACEYLERRGFEILERNYLRKWGEIDIVAKRNGVIRFIEVKSLAQELGQTEDVSHATYRPEENMHPQKLRRLSRTIQTYLLEKRLETDWQLDLVTVRIDQAKRIGRVEMLENIII